MVTQTCSSGTVSATGSCVGGLAGHNGKSTSSAATLHGSGITMSCSTCQVTGSEDVGGLVGYNGGSISWGYSAGLVTGDENTGGLVGRGIDSVNASFWDIDASGQTASAGGTGLLTAEMQEINTFLGAGWDFAGEISNGTCDYWDIASGSYPRLKYLEGDGPMIPEGLGTAEQPYLIRSVYDLGAVWFEPAAHYRLEASLDLSGMTWSMAVIPSFGGTFEGNGHVISNLRIKGGGYLGLFGRLAGGMVSNLSSNEYVFAGCVLSG